MAKARPVCMLALVIVYSLFDRQSMRDLGAWAKQQQRMRNHFRFHNKWLKFPIFEYRHASEVLLPSDKIAN
jgi:hypothetical protein